jgi:cytochrome P450
MESEKDTTGLLKVIHTIMVYQNYIPLFPGLHRVLVAVTKLLKIPLPNMLINQMIAQTLESYKDYDFEEKRDTKATPFFAKAVRLCQEGKADEQALYDSCGSNIVAGSDSTSAALSSAVYHIYNNPSVLEKLRAEIDSKVPRGSISGPIKFQDANQMPYLQAVIKEALRIAPPIGHMLPREVPAQGATFDGFYLPHKVYTPMTFLF